MSAIILQNELVHYEVLGRGRPLLFLHGWVGSWRYWIPTMQAASINHRTYALDLWGFGDSAKNPNYFSIEQQLALLEDFMEAMGIGKIAFIGHGLGAAIAMLFTRRYPQLVDRYMAVSMPWGNGAINPRLNSAQPGELAEWLLNPSPATAPVIAEVTKTDVQAIRTSLAELNLLDMSQLLRSSQIPCLGVNGGNDPLIESSPVETLNDLPESYHHLTFEESGHFPMLDETSKFNRLLSDFLSLTSGESPRQLQLKEEWKRRVR